MAGLTPQQLARMKADAQAARERISSGSFTPSWSITGKNAIAQAGASVVARLCPRWDIADSILPDKSPNPAYDLDALAYVGALDHWWQDDEGKWQHEWCPRTLDPEAACPICVAAMAYEQDKEKGNREFGKKLKAKPVYLFNAVIGLPRRRNQAGQADIRYIALTPVLFNSVMDFMTGGDNPQFGRGDITDRTTGYDLVFKRPLKDSGERWTAAIANAASPLVDDVNAFKGWHKRLINLEEMLQTETKSVAEIIETHGWLSAFSTETSQGPGAGEPDPGAQGVPAGFVAADGQEMGGEAPVGAPQGPEDEFLPPSPAQAPKAAGVPGRAPVGAPGAARRPTAGVRAPRR